MRGIASTLLLLVVPCGGCGDAPSEPTPDGTTAVRYQGTVILPEMWSADLDQGTLRSDTAADIRFEVVSDTERYLTPVGGTQASFFGDVPPEKSGCLGTTLSTERLDIDYLRVGAFICVVTGAGRIAQLDIVEAPGPPATALVVGVKTFALTPTDTTVNPPTLLSPPRDHFVHQYVSAPHCSGNAYGFSIDYGWTAVPGAQWYEIYAKHPGAVYPVLDDRLVFDTVFTDAECGAYIASDNAMGWTWRVTVVLGDGTRLTSLTGRYNFTDPFQP
jgi:hypothetical protein